MQKSTGKFVIFLLMLSIITSLFALGACNGGTEGLYYEPNIDCTSYCVSGIGDATSTKIVIPSTYDGKPVTAIGDNAFGEDSSIKSIKIPSSIINISNSAFRGCKFLEKITVAKDNPKYHSDGNCLIETETKTLIFGCKNSVIPTGDNVTRIIEGAFYKCDYMTSITIPNNITYIELDAFYGCNALTIYCEATNNDGLNYQFRAIHPVVWDCNNNDKDQYGYTYAVIDGIRYRLKDNMATVVHQPNDITEANIPQTVKYNGTKYPVTCIGGNAFDNCHFLTSVTIPNSVTKIEFLAFESCTALTKLVIPKSVTHIDVAAFNNCTSLTIYCEAESQPNGDYYWDFGNCPVVWGYKG